MFLIIERVFTPLHPSLLQLLTYGYLFELADVN
jgi:hypothetical protein